MVRHTVTFQFSVVVVFLLAALPTAVPSLGAGNALAAATSETITVPFSGGTNAAETRNSYSGQTNISVSGYGQASGTAYSDAFYIFTDQDGNPITPIHPTTTYDWTLWINGGPADDYVQSIPPYNSSHSYAFSINAPGEPLTFGVGDTQTSDNTGSYTIQLSSGQTGRGGPDNITLIGGNVSLIVGTSVNLAADVVDSSGHPLPNVSVTFNVSGPNSSFQNSATTNSKGIAYFTYTGETPGTYTFTATAGGVTSNSLSVQWSNPPDTTKPGGTWISPDNNFVITDNTLHFAAHAYDNPGGSGVDHVNFTALYSGSWHVVKTLTAPNGGGDIYQFDWDVSGVPNGVLTVSFDVYDKAGNLNPAPNGTRSGSTRGSTSSSQTVSLKVPARYQNGQQWSSDPYDNGTGMLCGTNIGQCGCALTSATMVLLYNGVSKTPDGQPLTPGSLNKYLTNTKGGYGSDGAFDWAQLNSISKAAGHSVYLAAANGHLPFWGNIGAGQPALDWRQVVTGYLTDAHPEPAVLGMTLEFTGNDGKLHVATHFVVVTGIVNGKFTINDPNQKHGTVDDYESVGWKVTEVIHYVKGSAPSAQNESYQDVQDASGIVVSVSSPASIVITDASGNQTGFAPDGASVVAQIPNSSVLFDPALSDATGVLPAPLAGTGNYLVGITAPANGAYQVQVSAPAGTQYTVRVDTIDTAGTPSTQFSQYTSSGRPTMLSFNYTSSIVSAPASAIQPAQPNDAPGCTYFPQTQHNLCGGFVAYWNQFGGLAVYGYPITEEFQDNGITTQYFERARFEWHPGAWPARYDVELGLLGDQLATQVYGVPSPSAPAPFQPVQQNDAPGCTYFPQTQHDLCGGFAAYWNEFGGLAVYGMPISEEFTENGVTVQYFERQRFEWHPGAWPERYDVELGLLGDQLLGKR